MSWLVLWPTVGKYHKWCKIEKRFRRLGTGACPQRPQTFGSSELDGKVWSVWGQGPVPKCLKPLGGQNLTCWQMPQTFGRSELDRKVRGICQQGPVGKRLKPFFNLWGTFGYVVLKCRAGDCRQMPQTFFGVLSSRTNEVFYNRPYLQRPKTYPVGKCLKPWALTSWQYQHPYKICLNNN
jgi:hypothetical protein